MTRPLSRPLYNQRMAIAVSLVEDDAQARKILAGWISRAPGFRFAGEWGEAETAVTQLPQQKPDVVLMDINLPGMSGVEAVRQLKPGLPQTQFVMLTVYEDADHIYDALMAGATGYLLKQTPRGCASRRFAHDQQYCAQGRSILPPKCRADSPGA
jgi:DNA-binding NarL/FixJ family response regulator